MNTCHIDNCNYQADGVDGKCMLHSLDDLEAVAPAPRKGFAYDAAISAIGGRDAKTGVAKRWVNVNDAPFPAGEQLHGVELVFAACVSDAQADDIQARMVHALNSADCAKAICPACGAPTEWRETRRSGYPSLAGPADVYGVAVCDECGWESEEG